VTADQEKLIKIFLQALQSSWENLRDYAWIIAGIVFLAITFLFVAVLLRLFRCGGRLITWDFASRRRLLESIAAEE